MRILPPSTRTWLVIVLCFLAARASLPAQSKPASGKIVSLTVFDENGLPVPGASVILSQPGVAPLHVETNYRGLCQYRLPRNAPYSLVVQKPGYYQTRAHQVDPAQDSIELTLTHQQIVRQRVDVAASPAGINPQQTAAVSTMNTPEIVNIPYLTSRDIRNVLPFNPGVIQDSTGQMHVAGSDTFATLDLLDGFNIRSPVSGSLDLRVSTDAVRTITVEDTRYPVQYGKATGGVISMKTGMGTNRFRFNATDFLPSFREIHGIRFDKFAPRITFSGPIRRDRAWYFDGFDMEYDNVFITELPSDADTNHIWRESNLGKFQTNLTHHSTLIGGLLFNNYYSPYDGLSSLVPQQSTTKRNTIAWLPYFHVQHTFTNGALLDTGAAFLRIRDGWIPHGDSPFEITPETSKGSYFENLTGHSRRLEEKMTLYLPPRHWHGEHNFRLGVDLDQIGFSQETFRAPINYFREDGTLLRRSTFPAQAPFHRDNFENGAYVEDHWTMPSGLVVEPGLRFDWDEIIRRPLFSPRIALTFTPGARLGREPRTKISAGIGLYYEHTPLSFIEEALAGKRTDTYYTADGTKPVGPPQPVSFTADYGNLQEPRVVNWSAGIERRLPGAIYAKLGYIDKHGTNGFVYSGPTIAPDSTAFYRLTNQRQFNYRSVDLSLRHTFAKGYTLFGDYMHSYAHTNAAIDYSPTLSVLGAQRGGPLSWDTPNRVISWGWLPVPYFSSWSFVYDLDWRTGAPYTSVNANQDVAGAAGSRRFPDFTSFSPGLEWKFHFHGYYFGLRGVIENATDSSNPAVVNNNIDSPQYGQFTEVEGRALTARIRLIGLK